MIMGSLAEHTTMLCLTNNKQKTQHLGGKAVYALTANDGVIRDGYAWPLLVVCDENKLVWRTFKVHIVLNKDLSRVLVDVVQMALPLL